MIAHAHQEISGPTRFRPGGPSRFGDGGVTVHYTPGEEVYAQEEDAAGCVYRLLKGAVRTSHLLADGRRQVGDFYYAGDMFGVETGSTHRFAAEALTACEVLVLNRSASSTPEVDRMICSAMAIELARTQEHMLLLARTTAPEKVARFLLDLADRFNVDLVTLPMSRQDMADYLGLTIETISRMLGRLQANGFVEFVGARQFRICRRTGLAQLAA